MNTKKVVLVGNSSSGKTLTCYKLRHHSLPSKNLPVTLGVEVHPFTTHNYIYKLWDCAGKQEFGGLRDGYYLQGNIALIFHGGDNYLEPEQWEKIVLQTIPNALVYHIVGNLEEKYAKVLEILS
jgi:GTPase SAR1 family protein